MYVTHLVLTVPVTSSLSLCLFTALTPRHNSLSLSLSTPYCTLHDDGVFDVVANISWFQNSRNTMLMVTAISHWKRLQSSWKTRRSTFRRRKSSFCSSISTKTATVNWTSKSSPVSTLKPKPRQYTLSFSPLSFVNLHDLYSLRRLLSMCYQEMHR